jgi:hypothetical protein
MSNATANCAKCGTASEVFMNVEPGMRLALKESGAGEVPERVCANCYEGLSNSVSQGLKLRMERDIREKNKMVMWKNRVQLIKNARALMSNKAYSEAAVQYEKYLRVLEMVHNLKKGELSPAIFNNSTRSKELTVIASVYWDLLRIYDTSPRHLERMQTAARKLVEFLPFSTIYTEVLKNAESFSRSAKNTNVVREVIRGTKASRGPCFVASAAFADDPLAPELFWLRHFRDDVLRRRTWGRPLVYLYYQHSPPIARWIGKRPKVQRAVRQGLTKFCAIYKKHLP